MAPWYKSFAFGSKKKKNRKNESETTTISSNNGDKVTMKKAQVSLLARAKSQFKKKAAVSVLDPRFKRFSIGNDKDMSSDEEDDIDSTELYVKRPSTVDAMKPILSRHRSAPPHSKLSSDLEEQDTEGDKEEKENTIPTPLSSKQGRRSLCVSEPLSEHEVDHDTGPYHLDRSDLSCSPSSICSDESGDSLPTRQYGCRREHLRNSSASSSRVQLPTWARLAYAKQSSDWMPNPLLEKKTNESMPKYSNTGEASSQAQHQREQSGRLQDVGRQESWLEGDDGLVPRYAGVITDKGGALQTIEKQAETMQDSGVEMKTETESRGNVRLSGRCVWSTLENPIGQGNSESESEREEEEWVDEDGEVVNDDEGEWETIDENEEGVVDDNEARELGEEEFAGGTEFSIYDSQEFEEEYEEVVWVRRRRATI
ncbi:hypothetical protein CC80DRAFT_322454 [Byssothecium circinans]|uniref:Uncharacterized protein n=1 Tax=Byssothecium circinans TaxID=147558 RepID=A0A6A5U2T9_9PLEO|nr:hypothetical protein CC80DRAFT_322454 [Byssothecium circinans]